MNDHGKEGMKIRPNPWRLRLAKQLVSSGKWTPFEKLMNMTQREMYGPKAGEYYAQAWSMIHFFLEAEDHRYFRYMKRYFKALRRGKNHRQTYEYAFKKADMKMLEERWKEHVRKLR